MLALVIRQLLASAVSVEHVREAMEAIKQTVIDRPLHEALPRSRWRSSSRRTAG